MYSFIRFSAPSRTFKSSPSVSIFIALSFFSKMPKWTENTFKDGWLTKFTNFLPEFNFNGIGNLDFHYGYQIKTNTSDVLELCGLKMSPEQNPITISNGWNLIAYLRDTSAPLEYALESINNNNIVIVKDFNGSPYLPEFNFNGIGNMIPGQGYQIKTNTFDEIELCGLQMLPEENPIYLDAGWNTIAYLREKIKAGADVIQLFDSWGGLLSPADYQIFSWPYLQQIVDALSGTVPVIVFGKGCWFALQEMSKSGAAALGIDWTCTARNARYLSGGQIALQGNFDPSRLLSPIPEIKVQVKQMINDFGKERYIVNLGHGILPNIPVDHAKAFVDAVKEYQS